jgi:hypothetical protein
MLQSREAELRGRLLLGGANPALFDAMPLRDWLDAGHAMLTERITDPLVLDCFGRLFTAETEDAMSTAFTELEHLGQAFDAKGKKALAERRKELGVLQMVGVDELAAAAAEWGMPMPEAAEPEG